MAKAGQICPPQKWEFFQDRRCCLFTSDFFFTLPVVWRCLVLLYRAPALPEKLLHHRHDLDRRDLNYRHPDYRDLDYRDLDYRDLDYRDLDYRDLDYHDLNRRDLDYCAQASTRKPQSTVAQEDNFCLEEKMLSLVYVKVMQGHTY